MNQVVHSRSAWIDSVELMSRFEQFIQKEPTQMNESLQQMSRKLNGRFNAEAEILMPRASVTA